MAKKNKKNKTLNKVGSIAFIVTMVIIWVVAMSYTIQHSVFNH